VFKGGVSSSEQGEGGKPEKGGRNFEVKGGEFLSVAEDQCDAYSFPMPVEKVGRREKERRRRLKASVIRTTRR